MTDTLNINEVKSVRLCKGEQLTVTCAAATSDANGVITVNGTVSLLVAMMSDD